MMDKFVFLVIAVVVLWLGSCMGQDASCIEVTPAGNFSLEDFQGVWYEIGKIQTPGGASWQQECVCTTMTITPDWDLDNGDSAVEYVCRNTTPIGSPIVASAQLIKMDPPGKWRQRFAIFLPEIDWTVMIQGQEFGMTYDCGTTFGNTEYCIHIVSRTPDQDPEVTQALIEYAESLGLNTAQLEYEAIDHTGCQ